MKKQIIWLGLIMAWMLCACEEDNKLMYDESSMTICAKYAAGCACEL